MKKYKNIALAFITLAVCASMAIPFMNGSHISSVDADFTYTILDSGMFTHDITISNNTYTLNCYRIKNYDNYIGISWGSSNAPATIDISSTITSNKPTGSNEDYTIVAVARAGFSHCTATTIKLPQTVVDIREEAFAYCQNLTSFIIPKDVTQIAPSTFLDCRSLSSIYYSNEDGRKTLNNSKITSFGDHAFDSCIKLRKLQCPTSAVFFGQSCFQKCSTLSIFRFPLDNGEQGDDRNVITIEDYAFADCLALQKVYFDINMQNISDYAFADSKSDLTFFFYDTQANFPASLSAKWRNKKITFGSDANFDYSTLVYDINYNVDKPVDGGYPGLTVSLSNAERKLDNARTNNTSVIIVPGGGAQYATITKFDTPDEDEWMEGYYENGVLTIPDEVIINNVHYPIKVIGPNAFGENDDLTEVHFNQHLVQICNRAFWHSNNIEILDFEECESLKEISYSIFNDIIAKAGKEEDATANDIVKDATIANANINKALTSLTLPNCLEYLGNFAFFNFERLTKELSFKTNPALPSNLKIIGDYAFAVFSDSSTNNSYLPSDIVAEMDVELPNSLDDAAAPLANIYHSFSYDKKGGGSNAYSTVNASIWNRVAINKNAFDNQDGLRSIKMESGGTQHDISFGSNNFIRNNGIIRFEASENLCLMGNEVFKSCTNLREVFLTGNRSKNNTHGCNSSGVLNNTTVSNPWGVGDGINDLAQTRFLFNTDHYYDLVVYVKEAGTGNNPLNYPNNTSSGNYTWYNISTNNSDANHYRTAELGNGKRANIPVYSVDWTTSGNIKYWHINDGGSNELVNLDDGPRTVDDYNNGYISFCKVNGGSNYTVARYYTDGSGDNTAKTIDLTSSILNGMTITTIGHEAFGGKMNRGYYFVLPTTITKIEERAFFRSDGAHGVRIVTFNNNGTIQTPAGSSNTFSQIVSTLNGQSFENTSGYCCLPNSVTRLERAAFYNNLFGSVELGVALTFIGNASFEGRTDNARTQSFLFTDYNDATANDSNSAFQSVNDGIYHKGKKILLHQAIGKTGDMTVYQGTVSIGYRAAPGSKYTAVTFDSATVQISGQAFKSCPNLTTLNNVSSLKYIGTSDSYPSQNGNYDKDDGNNTSNDTSAFESCTNLKVDFSKMTSLLKIGTSAFKKCTNIVTDLNVTRTYYYSTYTHSSGTTTTPSSVTKVLDLSTLTGLKNVNANAFESCSINYVITPNTTGTNYDTESNITFGGNAFLSTNARICCGETAQQADQSGHTANKPTTHYPNNALRPSASDYTKLYYRVHSADDLVEANTERRYWTAIDTGNNNEISIILFESKADAAGWLSNASNVASQRHSLA